MRTRVPSPRRARVAAGTVTAVCFLAACCQSALAGTYGGFSDPQPVTLSGYTGSAMEPEISPDGNYLLFNTSNIAPSIPEIQIATRTGANTFGYDGPLPGEGVNEPGQLSGTPSLDREGNLYFISPRAYSTTLSSIYAGHFENGAVTGVHLVESITGEIPGWVDFDAAVSPDGESIYASVGNFSTGSLTAAHIAVYQRSGTRFVHDLAGEHLLHNVNKAGTWDYAAAVSSNGLELFFTRAIPAKGAKGLPTIYRAARKRVSKPFAQVKQVGAISGFAEAPSLSDDGSTLYYHELVEGVFRIFTVTRPAI
jgi:WD40-like Beta Propeller Repeat